MAIVVPSVAGPKRPQDRIALRSVKASWSKELPKFLQGAKAPEAGPAISKMQAEGGEGGANGTGVALAPHPVTEEELLKEVTVTEGGQAFQLTHGDVVIAAITSLHEHEQSGCDGGGGAGGEEGGGPGADAQALGEDVDGTGSKVVDGISGSRRGCWRRWTLGFNIVGYGCTTCIGNSGPLPEAIDKAVMATNWWWPRCCRGTAILRGGCISR